MSSNAEQEIAFKLAQIRCWLEQEDAGALRLRGVDWFAWATAGGSAGHSLAAECGCAELLVTPDAAYVLSDEADEARMHADAVPGTWTWQVVPWAAPQMLELREHFVLHAARGKAVLCDRPGQHERSLPMALREERLVLLAPEQMRYRAVGHLAAQAAAEALRAARPHWTERELAGACVRALCVRGLQALYVLASGTERQLRYRRAPPAALALGTHAVLALGARGYGLCACLSRQRHFRAGQCGIDPGDAAMLALEAVALDTCEAGYALSMVYHALDSAYAYAGQPDTLREHRQGGIVGYQAPELAAGPQTELVLRDGMALAFHPSLPGVTVEDTFLLHRGQLHNLTADSAWPSTQVQGRRRPLSLELQ